MDSGLEKLHEQLRKIEGEIEDLRKRWPAHSLKPAMLQQMEDLEEERDRLKNLIKKSS